MLHMLRILPILAAVLTPMHAFGNGVTASFPAGGVVFEDNADIAIAREDLYLSLGEIRVDYIFRAETEQTETIGFPLPRVHSAYDSPDSVQYLGNASGDIRNYLDFGVAVDGRPIIPVLHEYAWIDDREVSAEILAAGLPLLPRYMEWEEEIARLGPETLDALRASGLINQWRGTVPEPRWEYQAVYEWQQSFAPGDTSVSIHYRPLLGWPGDYGAYGRYFEGELAEMACVDDALRKKITDLMEWPSTYQVAELDYITTSARHWSGPIGQFNLTAAATIPDAWEWTEEDEANSRVLIGICPADMPTDEEGNRHWTVTDYVPERDIHILYYLFSAY